jgi:hypothetical protein
MKILIDPMLAILAADLSTEDKAELLMCILQYPNRDCALGLWKYVKQQIDADAEKYREKCERAAAGRQCRAALKSTLKSNLKSELKSDLFSEVRKENESKDNIKKDNCNVGESGKPAGIVENPVDNFLISDNFFFADIKRQNPAFQDYIANYPPSVIEKAEQTIKQKRFWQILSMQDILLWVQNQYDFYLKNRWRK